MLTSVTIRDHQICLIFVGPPLLCDTGTLEAEPAGYQTLTVHKPGTTCGQLCRSRLNGALSTVDNLGKSPDVIMKTADQRR